MAYFMIFLIVMLPFYSSSAMAATITITKNTGDAGVPEFIDGQGDTWLVDVTIDGVESPAAEDVEIIIGQNKEAFKSCAGKTCSYISALPGVQENFYEFHIEYTTTDEFNNPILLQSQPSVIKVDGSSPSIQLIKQPKQLPEGPIFLDFTVNDNVNEDLPSVGIGSIDIIDSETGDILQSIDAEGKKSYQHLSDSGSEGRLSVQFPDEGQRNLRIEAKDLLGHQATLPSLSVQYDYVKPQIISETMNLTDLGKFIGEVEQRSELTVNIRETNNLKSVLATSNQADLEDQPFDDCERIENDVWKCTWSNVKVKPQSNIDIKFTITDQFNNKVEQTVSRNLVSDTTPPVVQFFGTDAQFQEVNYMKDGQNKLTLAIQEEGAGMDADGVRLNLKAVGRSGDEAPDECNIVNQLFVCSWVVNVNTGAGLVRVGLSHFEDIVGNKGIKQEKEIIIDIGEPDVSDVEIYGKDETGKRNFMRSNDIIVMEVDVIESSGLVMTVDMRDISNDPEVEYPAGPLNEAGFLIATEENCVRENKTWACTIESKPVKSGPINTAFVKLEVHDTAGNKAKNYPAAKNAQIQAGSSGKYSFALLGLDDEENPDFWGLSHVKLLTPFIDLDTTELIETRMPVEISLHSSHSLAKVLKVELVACSSPTAPTPAVEPTTPVEPTSDTEKTDSSESKDEPVFAAPTIKKAIAYGGTTSGGEIVGKPTILLEFNQFNGKEAFNLEEETVFKEAIAEYDCQLRIFSQIGKKSIKNAEIQDVKIPVVFSFSSLGAMDENIQGLINDARTDYFEVGQTFAGFAEVFEWINWAVGIISLLITLIQVVEQLYKGILPTLRQTAPAAAALFCKEGEGQIKEVLLEVPSYIQIPMNLLSCRPDPGATNYYGIWQQWVLGIYNAISLRTLIGQPAQDLRENYILSHVGLCIPGMLSNLEKYRQVQCREMLCYKNEVPQGLETVDSCAKLGEYLTCKYFTGPAVQFTPLAAGESVVQFVKSFATSPAAYINLALNLPCYIGLCEAPDDGTAARICSYTGVVIQVWDLFDGVLGVVNTIPSSIGNPYCSQLEDELEAGD